MNLRHKLISPHTIEELFNKYIVDGEVYAGEELLFLIDLVHVFRPKNIKKIRRVSIEELLSHLVNNPIDRLAFMNYLKNLLSNRKFSRMISDAGILQDSDFIPEVKKRLFAKILPYQPEKNTFEYILNQVFYKHSDSEWINKVPEEQIISLFELLEFSDIFTTAKDNSILSELILSMGLITQRMSGRAMESNIIRMVPEYNHLESPFLAFENEFLLIAQNLRDEGTHYLVSNDLNYKQLLILHKQCLDFVSQAFKNSSKYGISLKVNQSLLRIRQQLYRIRILISLLVVDDHEDRKKNTVYLALKLIEYNCYKYDVSKLIGESTQLLSYEITQHTAKTGEHYITESAKEYWQMFKASMGAGVIVGVLCIIKILMSKADASAFGFAFLYSINYAIGFTIIYLMGFTLATKQPAMTAATIIKAIEDGMKKHIESGEKHMAFAKLFARLFRSQFIAFVGNVLLAFPVALLGVWLIDLTTGINIVDTKWHKLLTDASPVDSPALFHAAIAGVFLFLSGIISGNVSNKNKHNQVYYRIQEHPWLKRNLGVTRTKKLANWFEAKWPGIVSNVWFGVFLGTTGSIGFFLGLNLDIRHITFVSGNIAMGIFGADFSVGTSMLVWAIIGMWLIGFVNFIVSFSLSLGLAFRSRNIPWLEVFPLIRSVMIYFKMFPSEFFFPPLQADTAVVKETTSKEAKKEQH
ncbi:site-specific recombinase [Flavobacterium sp. NKUCC04_CG]|uniref:site-specific recombinase n=1 Tax=Flavobacterium sp. NKUCC04_CG TaxID=2842121 RepID=UPI001C5AE548|nr:site-specific recombinase [Flavobacterium sp. NKUCC04_CG]MBW3518466.1 site-specific recombinase [Flavobacterium sp. NKUCC04_CG]